MNNKNQIKSIRLFKKIWGSHQILEIRLWLFERYTFLKEAKLHFKKDKPKVGSYSDYKKANWKHLVTYSEYMFSYEFWRLNEEQRNEFISTAEMQAIYRKLGNRKVRQIFHDKVAFLQEFHSLIHRKWALVRKMSFEQFKTMVEQQDCIAKPVDGTRGKGISKICANEVTNWEELYAKCVENNILLEECIQACDEIAAFHPSSLNTIRVVTFSGQGKCVVFGALFRMGAHGSVIDNTHAGGVYAPINVETGTIDVEAIDSKNHRYANHPDTGKPIKGFKIPYWEHMIEVCKAATQTIPNIHFAGWDLCVTKDGQIEIIEGNHAPDFDGGMQAPLKIGVKKKVQQTILEVLGVDPLEYISIWKFPKKHD